LGRELGAGMSSTWNWSVLFEDSMGFLVVIPMRLVARAKSTPAWRKVIYGEGMV